MTEVSAEADAADPASRALLRRLGARRTGGTVELRREPTRTTGRAGPA